MNASQVSRRTGIGILDLRARGYHRVRIPVALLVLSLLGGCSLAPKLSPPPAPPTRDVADGIPKPSNPNIKVEDIPDAVVRAEPKSPYGNPVSYQIDNQRYYPLEDATGFVESGIASWYGSKFHGRRTSSGEIYDAWKMTAAHKTLPLPSYVSVQDIETGKKIVVRVNDRGPFYPDRIIDLSYAAAAKLGIAKKGTGLVEIRALTPEDNPPSNRPSTSSPSTKGESTVASSTPASATKTAPSPSSPAVIRKETLPLPPTSASASASSPGPSSSPEPSPSIDKPMVVATAANTTGGSTDSSFKEAIRNVFLQLASFRRQSNATRLRDRLIELSVESVQMMEFRHRGRRYYRVRVGPLPSKATAREVADSLELESLGLGAPLIVSE